MIGQAIDALVSLFDLAQQTLFELAVQPLVFALGGASLLEDAFNATGWLLVGLLQISVMLLVFAPLQRWRPVETTVDHRAVRVDVIYTLIHRLGMFRLAVFFMLDPFWTDLWGTFSLNGFSGWHLDASLAPLWPGVTDTALAAFLLYLVLLDLFDYWFHRLEHRYDWWWALHAVHHSQRHMTMWTDSRNHLLDDLIRDVVLAVLARLIGVPPGQFVAVVACTQLLENLAHVNARVSFGWLGERLLVSPRFHRLHHAIGAGHESQGKGTLGGCNYAVLFPVWDVIFGTARFEPYEGPVGIRDQLPSEGGRDYGRSLWSQQRLGLMRLLRRG
ncbi:MAG: sterol desaturase family protein [Burkholderiales bacterium]|nr:sterol desaturase family protein [Burkholderiales bacterium]